MDRTDLVRLRWRLRGAWLWPSFLALTLVDAAVVHWLPPAGDSEALLGAWLIATVLMLAAIGLLSPGLGLLIRRRRRDLPRSVARNYGGTLAALLVSLALVAAGIANHAVITRDRAAMADALARAQAWIGAHAPAPFMTDLHHLSAIVIEAPELYRVCVANGLATRTYCVVVDRAQPFGRGVRFAGYESNTLLDQGVQ